VVYGTVAVAVCCGGCYSMLQTHTHTLEVLQLLLQCVAVAVAVCCSSCCSVLQCVADTHTHLGEIKEMMQQVDSDFSNCCSGCCGVWCSVCCSGCCSVLRWLMQCVADTHTNTRSNPGNDAAGRLRFQQVSRLQWLLQCVLQCVLQWLLQCVVVAVAMCCRHTHKYYKQERK